MELEKKLGDIDAILFDFDGVLLQSHEDHYNSWNAVFAEYQVQVGWTEVALMEGQNLFDIAKQLCQNHRVDLTEAKSIGHRKNELYKKSADIKFFDGAFEIIDFLQKRGFVLGLVTGALRDRLDHTVDESFKKHFDVIITANDVTHTKPHPEPFLNAAKAVGCSPDRCAVVENAPLGIQAAKSAGMFCVAVAATLPEEHLKEADYIVHDLVTLRKAIGG